MCGIAGIYKPQNLSDTDKNAIVSMTSMLSHRGPDDTGFYHDRFTALGHRRLSIIDIQGGKQPMHNEDKTVWVVFNGEIFNYLELMDLLKKKGHRFSTRSDTEVLVHLYEEYGTDFLSHLNGQFALALWDTGQQSLILARDRMGIRPLYYAHVPDKGLVFASEMKGVMAHPAVESEIDTIGLEQIFTMWVSIPPRTIFSRVNELAAGHFLKVTPDGANTYRYWKHTFPDAGEYDRKPLEWYTGRLRELVHDAVELRLRADVPVASYLSGGIDSSIISSLVKKYHNNDLVTFSVAFRDENYDERKYQEAMVRYLQTDHRVIEAGYEQISASFPEVVWYAENPMIRTAPAPLYLLSGLVRENGIKVVLTGEGADEVFGGYNIFKEDKVRRFWAKNPQSRLRPQLLRKLYPYITANGAAGDFWQMFFKRGLTDVENPYYSHMIRWNNTSQLQRFFTQDIRKNFNAAEHVYGELKGYLDPEMSRWDPLCRAQYLEMKLFMSGYLLSSQGDRMMMGHSVEGRFPFLDHRVVEFASQIPPEYKLRNLNEKYILKKTFQDLVPLDVVSRAKQPYRAPIAPCFTSKAHGVTASMLSEEAVGENGLLNSEGVVKLVQKCSANASGVSSARDDMALAAIVSLQLLQFHFNQAKDSLKQQRLYPDALPAGLSI